MGQSALFGSGWDGPIITIWEWKGWANRHWLGVDGMGQSTLFESGWDGPISTIWEWKGWDTRH